MKISTILFTQTIGGSSKAFVKFPHLGSTHLYALVHDPIYPLHFWAPLNCSFAIFNNNNNDNNNNIINNNNNINNYNNNNENNDNNDNDKINNDKMWFRKLNWISPIQWTWGPSLLI